MLLKSKCILVSFRCVVANRGVVVEPGNRLDRAKFAKMACNALVCTRSLGPLMIGQSQMTLNGHRDDVADAYGQELN
jgi:hypothetical protein